MYGYNRIRVRYLLRLGYCLVFLPVPTLAWESSVSDANWFLRWGDWPDYPARATNWWKGKQFKRNTDMSSRSSLDTLLTGLQYWDRQTNGPWQSFNNSGLILRAGFTNLNTNWAGSWNNDYTTNFLLNTAPVQNLGSYGYTKGGPTLSTVTLFIEARALMHEFRQWASNTVNNDYFALYLWSGTVHIHFPPGDTYPNGYSQLLWNDYFIGYEDLCLYKVIQKSVTITMPTNQIYDLRQIKLRANHWLNQTNYIHEWYAGPGDIFPHYTMNQRQTNGLPRVYYSLPESSPPPE